MSTSSETPGKDRGNWLVLLFAVPFLAVGAIAVGMGLHAVLAWQQMQAWRPVPCQIVAVDLEVHHDDDSTTYRATASYSYQVAGKRYQGSRVGIHTSADNLGDYHQRVAAELREHQRSGQPFTGYVNPKQPAEAVLYPRLRWEVLGFEALFGAIFGGAGLGLLWRCKYLARRKRREDQLKQAHPAAPWKWRQDWSEGLVRSNHRATWIVAAVLAAFWNLMSLPVLFFVPGKIQGGNWLASLALLFPAVGLLLLWWALTSFLRWRKFGGTRFRMAETPGVVGGKLAGVVETETKLRPQRGFRLTLTCKRTQHSQSSDQSSRSERVVWQDEQQLREELTPDAVDRSTIPVLFHIPFEAAETKCGDSGAAIGWELTVEADAPGTDFHATFEVPVFRTEASSATAVPDASPLAAYREPRDRAAVYAAAGIRREPLARGCRLLFAASRNWRAALSWAVFLAIWTGAIALQVQLGAPLLFPVVFGLFELLMIAVVVHVCLWFTRVTLEPGRLTWEGGLLVWTRMRSVAAADVEKIACVSGMQSGKKLYYDLALHLRGERRPLKLAHGLPNLNTAECVVEEIREYLGEQVESSVDVKAETRWESREMAQT